MDHRSFYDDFVHVTEEANNEDMEGEEETREEENDSFDCFTLDNEQQMLRTPYGDVPYRYYRNNESIFRANDIAKVLGGNFLRVYRINNPN